MILFCGKHSSGRVAHSVLEVGPFRKLDQACCLSKETFIAMHEGKLRLKGGDREMNGENHFHALRCQ